ncbi:hypothetical protein FQN54_000449 [Arachnomyces sp. PD_36]|nr:hypothetical protein FQN54_000449 [Arachnomyces sp. PD_36]
MDPNQKALEKKSRRKRLRAIIASIQQIENPYFSDVDLERLGIRRSSMSLEEKQTPLFFKPYTAPVLPPDIDTLTGYYPKFYEDDPQYNAGALIWYLNQYFQKCILPEEDSNPPGSFYTNFGDFNFGQLLDTSNRPHWQVEAAWNMPRVAAPHMKVLMRSNITGNENELFRGELVAVADVMRGRLHTKSLRPHMIAPVLLFSVVGMHHVRVLEAFFDGKELEVRTTGLYDLGQKNEELLIHLSRWWLGHASDKSTGAC